MLRFCNGLVLRGGELVEDDLWVDTASGKVIDPLELFYGCQSSGELTRQVGVVDCKGKIVSPGFIDLQFNGE